MSRCFAHASFCGGPSWPQLRSYGPQNVGFAYIYAKHSCSETLASNEKSFAIFSVRMCRLSAVLLHLTCLGPKKRQVCLCNFCGDEMGVSLTRRRFLQYVSLVAGCAQDRLRLQCVSCACFYIDCCLLPTTKAIVLVACTSCGSC